MQNVLHLSSDLFKFNPSYSPIGKVISSVYMINFAGNLITEVYVDIVLGKGIIVPIYCSSNLIIVIEKYSLINK